MANVQEHIIGAVEQAIQFELDRQVEVIVKDAEDRVKRAIHRIVANAVITAHDFYSIERLENNLVIKVSLMDNNDE